jgi:hypothetical protein
MPIFTGLMYGLCQSLPVFCTLPIITVCQTLTVVQYIDLQRETEENSRQPEAKLIAIAYIRRKARPCNAKRNLTRNPKPTQGAQDGP